MNPSLLSRLTDAELVRCAQQGANAAFDELARRHRPMLVTRSARTLRCRELGEEAAQEALLKAFRNIDRLTEPERVAAWLARIAANVCLDVLRRRQLDAVPFEPELHDLPRQTSIDERLLAKETIAALPENARPLVALSAQGYPSRLIGEMLRLPAPTVRDRISRARRALATVS